MPVSIESNLPEVQKWIRSLANTGIAQATKSAMIRTKPTMKKESVSMIKRFRKIKSKPITDRFKFQSNLTGKEISRYHIDMIVSRKPIRILNFIKGKKERQRKRGIAVSKRRKLKVEVVPGKVRRLKTAFIEKGRRGQLLVLQRQGRRPRPTRRLTGVYIHHMFAKPELTAPIEKNVGVRVKELFVAAVEQKMRKQLPGGTTKKE